MKIFKVLNFILICIGIMALSGCSTGLLKDSGSKGINQGEDIDPFRFGDEFSHGDITDKTSAGSSDIERSKIEKKRESSHSVAAPNNKVSQNNTETRIREISSDVYGYRVQIGIDEDKKTMEKLAEYARLKVDIHVYLEFDSPFYRVRLGDFKTKNEVEMYVKELKNIGFKDSLWVITKINPR